MQRTLLGSVFGEQDSANLGTSVAGIGGTSRDTRQAGIDLALIGLGYWQPGIVGKPDVLELTFGT